MTADNNVRPVDRSRTLKRAGKGASDQPDSQVAAALRSSYEEAVKEDVPAEFLDLLGKLS